MLGFLDKDRNVMETVCLYKLDDLRRIVAIFQGDEALDAAAEGLCSSFDPDSQHWHEKF